MVQLYTRRFQNTLPHKWKALYTRHVMTVNDRKYHRRSSSSSALICRTELLYNIDTKRAACKTATSICMNGKTESKSKANEKRVETPNGMTTSILKWFKAFRTILDWIRGSSVVLVRSEFLHSFRIYFLHIEFMNKKSVWQNLVSKYIFQ